MKAKKLLIAAIPAAAFILAACGGGGGGSNGSSIPPDTAITSSTDGSKAASAGTNGALLASNSTNALSELASAAGVPALRSPVASKDPKFAKLSAAQAKAWQAPKAALAMAISKAREMRAPTPIGPTQLTCDNSGAGGSGTLSGTQDPDAGTFSVTLSYTNCRVADVEWNGSVTLSGNVTVDGAGNATALTMSSTVSGFTAKFYSDALSSTVIADFTMSLTMGANVNFNTGATILSANGGEEFRELSGSTPTATYSINFANLQINVLGNGTTSGSSTFNGGITESWNIASGSTGAISLTYYNLAYGWSETTPGFVDWTINGTVTTNFTPDVCFEGTFTFVTTTPVHVEVATGAISAGVIVINGNTTVTYDPNGVTITVAGQQSVHTHSEFENACPVENMQAAA